MFLYNPCMKQSIPSLITTKTKVNQIACREQITEELARYATALPIYVSLMTELKEIITFLFLIGYCSNFHLCVSLIFLFVLEQSSYHGEIPI